MKGHRLSLSMAGLAGAACAFPAWAQCESSSYVASAGTPQSQGFTTDSTTASFEPTPDGDARYISDGPGLGLFRPPAWQGETGTRQEVRTTLRVIRSPMSLANGRHDSGFSIYRGRCIQGGNVVAGVGEDTIFISITNGDGAEVFYADAPFDTTLGMATYVFSAGDGAPEAMSLLAYDPATRRVGRVGCPPGRYSGDRMTWSFGDGSADADADVIVRDWAIARGLPPLDLGLDGPIAVCVGSVAELTGQTVGIGPLAHQWRVEDPLSPNGWRDIVDGPLTIGGTLVGHVSGTRTERLRFQTVVQQPPVLETVTFGRRTSNSCGVSLSGALDVGIDTAPAITSQPDSSRMCKIGRIEFKTRLAGGPRILSGWQIADNAVPGGWADLPPGPIMIGGQFGATADITLDPTSGESILAIETTPGGDLRYLDGRSFRCVAANACDVVRSDPATLRVCPADFDCDGFSDFFDLDSYIGCFEGDGCPLSQDADFNRDGFVDFFDLDDFISAFERGC